MKLRYSISQRSQILYIHSKDPKFLHVEYEGDFPHIWVECDNTAHHYPRRIDVHNVNDGPYLGYGKPIPNKIPNDLRFYDAGPGTTEEFNSVRWPNKAPMPLNIDYKGDTQ